MVDCLICVKPFIPEREFGNYPRNPELCASAISKLFKISRNPDVQGVLEDLVICVGCHQKLENVMDLLAQFEELQRKIDEKRIEFKEVLINSKDVTELMSTSRNLEMSKSSLDRLILLKAIETGNLPPALDHDEIDADNSDESSEEEQDPATDIDSEDSDGSSNEREILPATMFKDVKICLERVQVPRGAPTVENKVNSTLIPCNSKGGYALRNPKPTAKAPTQVEESSDEETSSDSESGGGSSSEDNSEGAGGSKRSSNVDQGGGNQPRRAYGSIIKEFTHLENGSFQCKKCSKIITYKKGLRMHLLIHGPRKFKCSFQGCGIRFTTKGHWNTHVKVVHEGRRDFKCSAKGCGKRFGKNSDLKLHMRAVHERRRDFKCLVDGCGKRFARKGNMTVHVRIFHEGRRDFKCGVRGCGKAFTKNTLLQKHMSKKHPKMTVARKKKVVVTPQAHVRPNLKVEIFECRMDPSCRNVYGLEWERDAHEGTHADN